MCEINCSGGCVECAPDEHSPGDYHKWLIERRIACPEAGYPISEACFIDYNDYLKNKNNVEFPCITS